MNAIFWRVLLAWLSTSILSTFDISQWIPFLPHIWLCMVAVSVLLDSRIIFIGTAIVCGLLVDFSQGESLGRSTLCYLFASLIFWKLLSFVPHPRSLHSFIWIFLFVFFAQFLLCCFDIFLGQRSHIPWLALCIQSFSTMIFAYLAMPLWRGILVLSNTLEPDPDLSHWKKGSRSTLNAVQ